MTPSALRKRILEALRRLAATADEQEAFLREMEVWPSADELALELEDVVKVLPEAVTRGAVSHEEEVLLRKLDDLLCQMSGEASAALWDASQLAAAQEWEEVRRRARRAQELFHVV